MEWTVGLVGTSSIYMVYIDLGKLNVILDLFGAFAIFVIWV